MSGNNNIADAVNQATQNAQVADFGGFAIRFFSNLFIN